MEDDVESSPVCGFFSKRANFKPKKNADELQAAAELVKKIQEENSKISEVERKVSSSSPKKARKQGKKKEKSQSQGDRGEVTDDSFSEVLLPAASKRRLKKLREEQELELQRIEAENQRILSSVDVNSNYYVETLNQTVEDFEKIAVLTVMYMSKTARVRCYENDKFLDIFPKVAELFSLGVTEFLLCLNTQNITVDDTPKSLNITDRDVLECIPYKADERAEANAEDSGNTFKIIFQSNDTKKKIDMLVHKIEKMQNIMKRYAEQRDIPLEQLIFDFDGERLSGDETPADLDMEAESCIDVTVLVPTSNIPISTSKTSIPTSKTPIPTSKTPIPTSKTPIPTSKSPKKTPIRKTPTRRGRGRGRGSRGRGNRKL